MRTRITGQGELRMSPFAQVARLVATACGRRSALIKMPFGAHGPSLSVVRRPAPVIRWESNRLNYENGWTGKASAGQRTSGDDCASRPVCQPHPGRAHS